MRLVLVVHGGGGAQQGEEGTQQSTSKNGEGGETLSFAHQSVVCSLLSRPECGGEEREREGGSLLLRLLLLSLSSYLAEVDETAAVRGKECHGFDKFKNYALFFWVD